MANELNTRAPTGLTTLVARIYANGWVQQGSDIPMVEVGAGSGLYSGTVPGAPAIANGEYNVLFVDTVGTYTAGGTLRWTGGIEDRVAIQNFIEGGRNIDFVGSDTNGWQRVERDPSGTELARYNLFDQDNARIDEPVANFIGRGGMIANEELI